MANTVGISYQSKFYNNIILAGDTTSKNPAAGELGYDSANDVIKYGNANNAWVTLGSGSEHGIPTGGDKGQVLAKKSNTAYDVEWVNAGGSTSTMHAMTETITVPSGGGDVSVFESGKNVIPYLLITGTNIATFNIQSWKIDAKNNATLIEPDLTIIENTAAGTTSVKAGFAAGEGGATVRMCLIWSAAGTENGTEVNGMTFEQNTSSHQQAES